MSLIKFAEEELKAIGYKLDGTDESANQWIIQNIIELITVFSKQGHSGMSAPYCVEMFTKLASYMPLAPLTGDDNEWVEVTDDLFQNKRCGRIFKGKDGRAYDIDGNVFCDADGCCFTNFDSRVYIEFPYTPKSQYIDRRI
jgi:hypothetical protein